MSAAGPASTIGRMVRYVIRGGREGYGRLRVLAAARRASTLELFQLAGLRPGMRCVDLGWGSGDVTLEMAALSGPGGWAAGVDADRAKLELARAAARERGLANVVFEVADVGRWAGPGEYDFVYCRFLLQHLARPGGSAAPDVGGGPARWRLGGGGRRP